MNKTEMIVGTSLVGLPFLCIGVIIGGIIVNKFNSKCQDGNTKLWKATAELTRVLFEAQCKENIRLQEELGSKKEA